MKPAHLKWTDMKNFPNDFKQADLFDARIHIGGMHGALVPLAPTRMTVLNKFHDGMEVIPVDVLLNLV